MKKLPLRLARMFVMWSFDLIKILDEQLFIIEFGKTPQQVAEERFDKAMSKVKLSGLSGLDEILRDAGAKKPTGTVN